MTRVLCRKTLSGMQPADMQAEEEFRRVPMGKSVYMEIKTARNPRQHRLLFAMLKIVVDNTELFPTVDAALLALKVGTGMVDMIPYFTPEGVNGTAIIPRSISFANMTQGDFSPWFQDALHLAATRWLNVLPDDLRREVEEMVG